MAFCPHCGKPTEPATSFCTACGRSLTPAPPAPPPPPPAMGPPAYAPLTPPAAPVAGAGVRPVGVTIIGVVSIIMGGAVAVGAFFLLMFAAMGGAWMGAFMDDMWGVPWGAMGGAFMILAFIGAIFLVGFAALAIAAGLGSLRGRPWAWILTLVMAGLMGLNGLGDLATQDFGGALGVLIAVAVIVYYFQPDVKRWFGRPA